MKRKLQQRQFRNAYQQMSYAVNTLEVPYKATIPPKQTVKKVKKKKDPIPAFTVLNNEQIANLVGSPKGSIQTLNAGGSQVTSPRAQRGILSKKVRPQTARVNQKDFKIAMQRQREVQYTEIAKSQVDLNEPRLNTDEEQTEICSGI